jgi:hypothetical protein
MKTQCLSFECSCSSSSEWPLTLGENQFAGCVVSSLGPDLCVYTCVTHMLFVADFEFGKCGSFYFVLF